MPDTTIVKDLTNDELDRAGAVEVLGWTHPPRSQSYYSGWYSKDKYGKLDRLAAELTWSPSTSPTDDYAVLVHVMENWGPRIDLFAANLATILESRMTDTCGDPDTVAIFYQTGDNVRAAVQTVREAE